MESNNTQASKKTLRRYDVSEEVFDLILETMQSKIEITDCIQNYFTGYKKKHTVMYDNKEYLIIREHLLAYFADFSDDDYQDVQDWRQVIVRKCAETSADYTRSIDGSRAYKHTKSVICDFYSEEEYDQRLRMFEAEKDLDNIQFHYQYPSSGCVLSHSNSFKYDINGAHHDALIEIFPKAESALRSMFERRKEEPLLKSYINYFVGMLTRKGYRKTYNWIVQRVSKTLKEAIEYCGGELIYANTDGFLVSNPERTLEVSKDLGKFKLEFKGTAYTYQDKNYWCYQAEKLTGSIRYLVRELVDLSKGQVVHYDNVRTINETGIIVNQIKNIVKEQVNVYKEN